MTPAQIDAALKRLPHLPDTAIVPIAVVAIHDGVDELTVRRYYPTVRLTPRRVGVLLGYLRNRAIKLSEYRRRPNSLSA